MTQPGTSRRSRARALAALVATVCVCVCALALAARTAAAAPLDLAGDDWEGLSEFVRDAESELGAGRVTPLGSTLDLHLLQPDDALVLVHPTRALDTAGLSSFMHAGGRVVLLDDYGTGDALLALFGIRRRPLPRRPAEALRGNPAFAIAEPAGEHSVVRDVARVVTNHATGVDRADLAPLLVVRGDGEPDVLLAVAGVVGHGRLVAVGDASVCMNAMLRYPGNRALAVALVRYAGAGAEETPPGAEAIGVTGASTLHRPGKVYVLANEFETTGTFGDDSAIAGAASEAQRSAARALESLRHDGMPPLLTYLAAVLVGLGVVVWTGTRAGKTHRLATPCFARPVPVVAQGGVAGRAAVLGAPGTSRALAVLELKSALEEDLAARLGLVRAPSSDQLVAQVRASGLLDAEGARELTAIFARLARVESRFAGHRSPAFPPFPAFGVRLAILLRRRDGEVKALAADVRRLREKLGAAGRDNLALAP